jgi:hypothetical protein
MALEMDAGLTFSLATSSAAVMLPVSLVNRQTRSHHLGEPVLEAALYQRVTPAGAGGGRRGRVRLASASPPLGRLLRLVRPVAVDPAIARDLAADG